MRLKNIKLAGFKSFVDPTNVQLTTNLVAVVGPNGCGKSNIIDAVRWVMGESSAKNLRGESMADVIFNGSTARKPVGQASIELVFENSEGKLKGEYGGFSEISIKRKVTREGQSQYFINGAKCRRRDITDIFLGTGLGPRSYAIIEQGMISRLIESKPEELRVFVEEAAGISKYKERRRETETRIRHTRENLERLTDLREELERQLQKLKRQASAAEKYKAYKAEERELKAQTLSLQWQALREQSTGQREAIAQYEIDLEASIAEQRKIDASLEALRQQQTEKSEAFNEVQAKYYGVGAEIARLEQSLEHCEQRAKQLTADLEETERNTAENQQHLEDDQQKLASWSEELSRLEPEHNQLTDSESRSSESLRQAEANMADWQQRWDDFNANAAEPQKNAEIQRTLIDQVEDSLRGLGLRMERLNKELEGLSSDAQQGELVAQREAAEKFDVALVEVSGELEQAGEQVRVARHQRTEAAAQLSELRQQLQEQRGRYASIEALQKAAQAETSNGAAWLKQSQLDRAPRLLDQLKVEKGWEPAIETVLGDCVQAVAIKALDDVAASLEQLEDANMSFVEAGAKAGTGPAPSDIGLSLLREKVTQGVIPDFLSGVYVARNLTEALASRAKLGAGQSIVTSDGFWMGQDWLRVLRDKDTQRGSIERQNQLEQLRASIDTITQNIEQSEQSLAQIESSLIEFEQAKDATLQRQSQWQTELGQARAAVVSLQQAIEQVARQRQRTAEEIDHARVNQQQQREALSEARAKLDTAIESMQQVEEQRELLLQERDKVRDTLVAVREEAKSDRDALQAVAVRRESLKAQIHSVESTVERLEKQVAQLGDRYQALRAASAENAEPVPELKSSLEQQLASRLLVETELADARKAVEAMDLSLRETEQARSQAEQATQGIRGNLEKARIDSQEMAVRTKTIEEQLDDSGFQLQAVIDGLPTEAELVLWQSQLDDVTQKIERLGAINLASIEELKTESERKKYLDAQNEELESALSTLENAIHKIDRETRQLFKETFDTLNDSLQDLFPKVFGGGAAYLEMTGDDLLNTGIAIMAQPPGKRNSTIHLLSGGEKALTAIALVFSIFQLNPAPFCMLDEVDAPLDDANTGRYARLITEMSDRVQFIFITHNKITMEMADHLMGVTMHEPGCSRLVSVDIDEAVALATA